MHRTKATALALLLAGCGNAGQPAPTSRIALDASTAATDAAAAVVDAGSSKDSSGPGEATDANVTDAAIGDAPIDAVLDVSGDSNPEASIDAGPALDAGDDGDAGDAGDDGDAAVAPFLCPGGRDVFTMMESGPIGPFTAATTESLTNLNSTWIVGGSPFMASAGNGSVTLSIEFDSNTNGSPSPGTYSAIGSGDGDGGFVVQVGDCDPVSGGVTVVTNSSDDAGVLLFQATYSVTCTAAGYPNDELSGCIEYQGERGVADASVADAEPGYDSGIVDTFDAAAEGGDYLAPCLGQSHAIYVEGATLTPTPIMLTEVAGEWSGVQNGGNATIAVETASAWEVEMGGSPENPGLTVGTTYNDAGPLPSQPNRFALEANGVSCGDSNGSFTIWDYEDTGGDEGAVTRLTASFETTCLGGVVRGCVRYTN